MLASSEREDDAKRPRKPQQARARARVERVLQEAERVIEEGGVDAFSIPVIAERLGFPRATIYKFFPTPYALLNELAQRHLRALEAQLLADARSLESGSDWRTATRAIVRSAAAYYRHQPVACMLLLGGPTTEASYRAMEYSIARLGRLCREMLSRGGLPLPDSDPDLAALAVEFGTASFRYAYFAEGVIGEDYVKAASDVMIAFLGHRLSEAGLDGGLTRTPSVQE